MVTGLGTPKAEAILAVLSTAKADTGTGTTTTTGGTTSGGGGTTTSSLTLSPVEVSILTTPAADAVAGTAGVLKLRLTNAGTSTFAGSVTVILYASTSGTDTTGQTVIETLPVNGLKLKVGATRGVTLKYTLPASLATGTYYLVAAADATGTDTQATTAATAALTVAAQSADLSIAFASAAAVAVTPGAKGKALVRITDVGNATAKGTVTVTLYATTTGVVDGTATQLLSVARKVKVTAGRAVSLTLPFTAPAGLDGGTYTLVAVLTSATTPTDTNAANDTATSATTTA